MNRWHWFKSDKIFQRKKNKQTNDVNRNLRVVADFSVLICGLQNKKKKRKKERKPTSNGPHIKHDNICQSWQFFSLLLRTVLLFPCKSAEAEQNGKKNHVKGEVRATNDRNVCERRSCMKNNGKRPTFKFVSGEERRSSEVQRVYRGWRPPDACTCQRIPLGSENDWKFRLRSCQSWKASSLSLGVVVPTSINQYRMRYVGLGRDNLRSHFVFRPRHAPEWLGAWFLLVVFLANEGELTGKTFTTSLNTTNPNTYMKLIFLRTSPLRCPGTLFISHEHANFLFSVFRVVQGEAKTPKIMGCCRAFFAFLHALKIGTFRGKWTLNWVFKTSHILCLALYFCNQQQTWFFFACFSTMSNGNCKKNAWFRAQNSVKNNFLPLCWETSLAWKFLFLCSSLKNYPWTFEKNSFFNKLWA